MIAILFVGDVERAAVGLMDRRATRSFLGALTDSMPPASTPKAEIYLRVTDLRETIERLERNSATCTSPLSARDWGDEAAYFIDPDGYVLAVARSMPPSANL